jgi:alpha-glucosidase
MFFLGAARDAIRARVTSFDRKASLADEELRWDFLYSGGETPGLPLASRDTEHMGKFSLSPLTHPTMLFRVTLIAFALFWATLSSEAVSDDDITLLSPNRLLKLTLNVGDGGRPTIDVFRREVWLAQVELGLDFVDAPPLAEGFKIALTHQSSTRLKYEIPVGKASSAEKIYDDVAVVLRESQPPHRQLRLEFRAFDDGVAFRYELPKQESLDKFVLRDELTQFTFFDDPLVKALPLANFTTSYEAYYETKKASELTAGKLFGLPMLLQHPKQVWLAVTEANLTDYAGMYLSPIEGRAGTFATRLSPLPGQSEKKVVGATPFVSPWRVLMIADDPGRLIESNLVFNLSDPPAFKDTSWIKPGATTFPWWNHYVLEGVDFEPGVNTATMKHYIDFCAANGIPYHSLDGLDIAWYGGPIAPTGPTDVTKAAPSIDLPEVLRYAKEKGVRLRLWMHWKALKPQIDEAFATYEKWGIEGVMVDFMDRDDQEMVRFYHEMASKAAKHHLTLTLHGAYKPTGMERTWPNVLTYEAALNQEYNKWQPPGIKGTPPGHNLDIAFVRMLAGPLDYHQGGMRNVLPENYRFRDVAPPVQGTRGHQLAMYVVYQNHLPMIADYPEAYRDQAGFDFLTKVPATWDETRVLHAELDVCLVIARRRGKEWFVGGMTASNGKELELPLSFLGAGSYETDVYLDDPSAGPTALDRQQRSVSATDKLPVSMPPSGGFVTRLKRISKD